MSNKNQLIIDTAIKKIALFLIGSGLLTNAIYIYGLGYYQGYIEGLGFEYILFPIEWKDAPLWTYFASQELGVSTITAWTSIPKTIVLIIFLLVYVLARAWIALSNRDTKPSQNRKERWKWLVEAEKNHSKIFSFLKWFFIKEQSFWAFLASYFFLLAIMFIPLLIAIWIYFPIFGVNHGAHVAEKRLETYKKDLCHSSNDKWSRCISIATEHISGQEKPQKLKGRIVFKKDDLLGILTEEAPITLTRPSKFYSITHLKCSKNDCLKIDY